MQRRLSLLRRAAGLRYAPPLSAFRPLPHTRHPRRSSGELWADDNRNSFQFCMHPPDPSDHSHPGGNPGANRKSISHRCHLILVAFVKELTKETIYLPLGCLQGGNRNSLRLCTHPPDPSDHNGGLATGAGSAGEPRALRQGAPHLVGGSLQGYFAHKRYSPRRTLQYEYA